MKWNENQVEDQLFSLEEIQHQLQRHFYWETLEEMLY